MKTRIRQLFAAMATAAASSASTCTAAGRPPPPAPVPDAFLGERLYPNEEALAQRLSSVIDETTRRQYQPGNVRRDAHAKAHGCVRAEFRVDENPTLASRRRSYQARPVRRGSGSHNGNPDAVNKPGYGRHGARHVDQTRWAFQERRILESEREDIDSGFCDDEPSPSSSSRTPSMRCCSSRSLAERIHSTSLRFPFTFGQGAEVVYASQDHPLKTSNPQQTRYCTTVPYHLCIGPDRLAIKYLRAGIPLKSVDPDAAQSRSELSAGSRCA